MQYFSHSMVYGKGGAVACDSLAELTRSIQRKMANRVGAGINCSELDLRQSCKLRHTAYSAHIKLRLYLQLLRTRRSMYGLSAGWYNLT